MTTDTYYSNGNEVQLFELAFQRRLPVMLTGPTGCGKTRLVEHMGVLLQRPVVTISCHDDLTSSDLVGRFMVTGGDVVWTDGPLTRPQTDRPLSAPAGGPSSPVTTHWPYYIR